MDGRKSFGPRFTILDKADLLDNKKAKPIDRSNRFYIDNWNLRVFWSIWKFREDFMARAERVRQLLEIPILTPTEDRFVQSEKSKRPPVFAPKSLYIGVNSEFLRNDPIIAKKIEKAIYNNFLVPYNWSFNYYPFVEYYLLYGKPTAVPIKPNPRQFQLILKYNKELGRGRYTKCDIAFLRQQAVIEKIRNPKQQKRIETITTLLPILKNTDRRPKNPQLKVLAFNHFSKLDAGNTGESRFLADQGYSILESSLGDKEELTELTKQEQKKLHQIVRKLHVEYLNLIHSV